jgi:hypothetical protein
MGPAIASLIASKYLFRRQTLRFRTRKPDTRAETPPEVDFIARHSASEDLFELLRDLVLDGVERTARRCR